MTTRQASLPPSDVPALTREQVRRVDQLAIDRYGMSGLVLMENAGRGCVDRLASRHRGAIVVCCGKGNNAGDGFVVARHWSVLRETQGFGEVTVLLADSSPQFSADAAANARLMETCGVSVIAGVEQWPAPPADGWIIDALLGTGTQGDPRPPVDAAIRWINDASAPVMALDLPSGLDCDTGKPGQPCVEAALTATFVAPKVGFASKPAAGVLGLIETVDIGVPRRIISEAVGGNSPPGDPHGG